MPRTVLPRGLHPSTAPPELCGTAAASPPEPPASSQGQPSGGRSGRKRQRRRSAGGAGAARGDISPRGPAAGSPRSDAFRSGCRRSRARRGKAADGTSERYRKCRLPKRFLAGFASVLSPSERGLRGWRFVRGILIIILVYFSVLLAYSFVVLQEISVSTSPLNV